MARQAALVAHVLFPRHTNAIQTLMTTTFYTGNAHSSAQQWTELFSAAEDEWRSRMYALSTRVAEPEPAVPAKPSQSPEQIYAALTLAFAADPPCRWLYPQPDQYLRYFPAFARAFGGTALVLGTVLADDGGAALWLPPGAEPDGEALIALLEESMEGPKRDEAFLVFAEMARVHPTEPHWYLPLVGVEPGSQGQGLGTALIRPILEQCDASGLPAYLEATSPRSRRLYERLGFEAVGAVEVGSCPAIIPMLRRP